jgi:hypothetical protein
MASYYQVIEKYTGVRSMYRALSKEKRRKNNLHC